MDTSGNKGHMDIMNKNSVRDLDFEIRQVCFHVREIASFLSWLRDLSCRNEVVIVCFNADLMAGREHVVSAMTHAIRAKKNGTGISSSLEIEALLYAAGSRQCQEAIQFGVHQGSNNCYLCIYPINPQVWPMLSTVMALSPGNWEQMTDEKINKLIALFGITSEEIAVTGLNRLKDLVLERVALLEVNK